MQDLAGAQGVSGSGTCTPGPPPYDSVTQGPSELPPPSYAEAVALLHHNEINGDRKKNQTIILSFQN